MRIQQLKDAINNVFDESYSVQVYLVLKTEQQLELRLADIENGDTATEIRTLFSDYIKETIIDNDELELSKLSTDEESVNSIYQYDYDDYPEELGLFKNFNISEAIRDVKKFDFLKDSLSALYGYIIYLGSMDNGIILFKKHYSISLIKRDSFLLGAVKSKQRFEKMIDEDIIRLNGKVELIRIGDEIFVLDIKVLERNLGFNKLIYKSADETIQLIDNLELLEDIQVLKDTVEDISFARKLSKVKSYSPIIKLNIPKETVIAFTKSTDALIGKFKYSEDGKKIRLDTKKSKQAFVKLMNDSFLHSELTKQYYETKAKTNITQQEVS